MELLNHATIPRAERVLRRATCQASDAVGACVRIIGPAEVETLDITDVTGSPAVGVIIDKPSPTEALVQFSGPITGVYSGLAPGDWYLVSVSGVLSPNIPVVGAGQKVFVQHMGWALDDDVFMLVVQTPKVRTTA